MSLYDDLKDRTVIKRVNELFYEKVYNHPWLSKYFESVSREFITRQQTDYIIGEIGGPKLFTGRLPYNAHPHMFLTDELFDIREALLNEAFEEANVPAELRRTWLNIDESFRSVIVKKRLDECEKRFMTDKILAFDKDGKNIA